MTAATPGEITLSIAATPANSCVGTFAKFSKMKILIVDDEPANVALLEGVLADNGYTRVKSVTDARLAIENCKTFQPDLVLLDLMMPYVGGLIILETIRSEPSDVFLPVLVLTADVNEERKLRALRAGATDFLLKPFDQVEVLLRIANLLEIRRLHVLLDNQRAALEESVRARGAELRDLQSELGKTTAGPVPKSRK
jgi:putative two-component system response regulator